MRTDFRELAPGAGLLALLCLTAGLYWPGLSGGLILDDFNNLEPLELMAAGGLGWGPVVADNDSGPLGRPVAMLSFVLNWVASGGAIWALKYTNLMLHLLTGALIFWLTGRLLAEPRIGVERQRWWVALWVAAAWLVAPLLVSTVLYVIQRMAQLAALFVVAGLLCYVVGRQNLERHFRRGAALILVAFVVFWPLAALSKENGALLPLLALLMEAFVFRFGFPAEAGRLPRRFLIGVFTAVVGLPAAGALLQGLSHPGWVTGGYAARDFTLSERLLTESRALFDYAGQLVLPRGAAMGVYHDGYLKSSGLLSPPTTLVAIAAWMALAALAWWKRGTRVGWVLFGVVFFLAAHALESSIFPLELYFEHRNYLPAYGIFLALALAAWYVWQRAPSRRLVAVVLVLLPMGYAASAYQRVLVWRSPETILVMSERTHPDSPRVHAEMANLYMNKGRLQEALEELNETEALYKNGAGSSGVALQRLLVYCVLEAPVPERAYAALERLPAADDDPYTVASLKRLSRAVQGGKCTHLDLPRTADAVHRLVQARVGGNPDRRWNLHIYAARVLIGAERNRAALDHLQAARRLFPEQLIAGLMEVQIQLQLGNIEAARSILASLKEHDPRRVRWHTRSIEGFEQLLKRVDEVRANVRRQ